MRSSFPKRNKRRPLPPPKKKEELSKVNAKFTDRVLEKGSSNKYRYVCIYIYEEFLSKT